MIIPIRIKHTPKIFLKLNFSFNINLLKSNINTIPKDSIIGPNDNGIFLNATMVSNSEITNNKYANTTLKFKYSNNCDLCFSFALSFKRIWENDEIKTETM